VLPSEEYAEKHTPLLRVMATNTRCSRIDPRAAGELRFQDETSEVVSGAVRLYYKSFGDARPACAMAMKGGSRRGYGATDVR
jgi:hypothetical protein